LKILRITVPIFAAATTVLLFFTGASFFLREDISDSASGQVTSVDIEPGDYMTQQEYRLALYDQRTEAIRRHSMELRRKLNESVKGFKCVLINRRGFLDTLDRVQLAEELVDIYYASKSRNERHCYRYEWSGVDSSGTKYILIGRTNTRYLALYPSDLDGGPKLIDRNVSSIEFGYIGDRYQFVSAPDEINSLNPDIDYRLLITFEEDQIESAPSHTFLD